MPQSFVFVGATAIGQCVADNLIKAGFVAAGELSAADIVVTYCKSQEDLENVYFDGAGIIASARKGALLIDLSPTTPAAAKEMAGMAQVSDLRPVEAPLYVRDPTVPDAFKDPDNLALFAAGEFDDVQAAEPALDAIAGRVERTGEAGSAQLAKCALTIQQAIGLVGVIESDALVRAVAGEVDAHAALERALALGTVPAWAHSLYHAIEGGAFASTYTVEIIMNEVSCALSAAEDADLIVPQIEAVSYLLNLLATLGGVDMSAAAVSLAYRDEDTAKKHGLDWNRAQEAYEALGGHDHDHDDDDEYDFDDDDDDRDPSPFGGAFGGYSAN